MKILGIDPGYERVGIAIIEKNSVADVLIHSECYKTPPSLPHSERLLLIGKRLREIIATFSPEVLAIETLFFNSNQKTAMPVAEARGVIIYCCQEHGLGVVEFSPPQIKSASTGYGKADKSQIKNMVTKLIRITKKITHDDEYDAIAVAITASATSKQWNVDYPHRKK
jgi:crossover junction endodeoxyribonuclease RuvC